MNILLIGGGGREHALAWKIAQSQLVKELVMSPGNPGMQELGRCEEISDPVGYAKANGIDLVVVGPEQPLADGLADRLEEAGIPCFGPVEAAARLETSKAFTKEICNAGGIPTAAYGHFTQADDAKAFLGEMSAPYVIKADGLMAGKGVIIAKERSEAETAIDALMKASGSLVIEEFMDGYEVSVFALSDGESILRYGHAADYKRAYDGDEGPNTGGMGAVSPAPRFDKALEDRAYAEIIEPTIRELKNRDISYRGVLYAGLMITAEGPKLVEFNCRFGDPECQILMRRLRSDIVPALWGAATGRLGGIGVDWRDEAGVLITYASKGYPGSYDKGTPINGLDEAADGIDTIVFHAGTGRDGNQLVATGGRVLSVTALGEDISEARTKAYAVAKAIEWPGGYFRTDIASGF